MHRLVRPQELGSVLVVGVQTGILGINGVSATPTMNPKEARVIILGRWVQTKRTRMASTSMTSEKAILLLRKRRRRRMTGAFLLSGRRTRKRKKTLSLNPHPPKNQSLLMTGISGVPRRTRRKAKMPLKNLRRNQIRSQHQRPTIFGRYGARKIRRRERYPKNRQRIPILPLSQNLNRFQMPGEQLVRKTRKVPRKTRKKKRPSLKKAMSGVVLERPRARQKLLMTVLGVGPRLPRRKTRRVLLRIQFQRLILHQQ